MSFEKIHAERLQTLANFLLERVEEEKFSSRSFIESGCFDIQMSMGDFSKIVANARGYLPVVFPFDWEWRVGIFGFEPRLKDSKRQNEILVSDDDVRDFFGLESRDSWLLCGSDCPATTPKNQALMIETFLERKSKEARP